MNILHLYTKYVATELRKCWSKHLIQCTIMKLSCKKYPIVLVHLYIYIYITTDSRRASDRLQVHGYQQLCVESCNLQTQHVQLETPEQTYLDVHGWRTVLVDVMDQNINFDDQEISLTVAHGLYIVMHNRYSLVPRPSQVHVPIYVWKITCQQISGGM